MAEWDYMEKEMLVAHTANVWNHKLIQWLTFYSCTDKQQEDENQWNTVMQYENFLISYFIFNNN